MKAKLAYLFALTIILGALAAGAMYLGATRQMPPLVNDVSGALILALGHVISALFHDVRPTPSQPAAPAKEP